jgi:hypothetical protein
VSGVERHRSTSPTRSEVGRTTFGHADETSKLVCAGPSWSKRILGEEGAACVRGARSGAWDGRYVNNGARPSPHRRRAVLHRPPGRRVRADPPLREPSSCVPVEPQLVRRTQGKSAPRQQAARGVLGEPSSRVAVLRIRPLVEDTGIDGDASIKALVVQPGDLRLGRPRLSASTSRTITLTGPTSGWRRTPCPAVRSSRLRAARSRPSRGGGWTPSPVPPKGRVAAQMRL